MLLLAVDTSGKQGGISLAQCKGESCEIIETSPIAGGTFSARLIPQIAEILSKHRFKAPDLGALAAVSGPGSFTGLRVGLSAVKGLGEVLHLPIVSLSLLELMAASSNAQGRVLAVLDAGRNECYCSEYQLNQRKAELVREFLLERASLSETATNCTIIACEEVIVESLRQHAVIQILRPDSASAARLAWQKLLAGQTTSVEDLDANYIRRSDAEIFSKPKLDTQKRNS